ncbi:histone-lysine N-methyltransferase SETMAR [Nephila pilipes]|uniref:Histone-lysine N-methyltransferase SETMAR n=1 Tax=Nephila pilipes TaxID=299642 RepID=A0A8X6P104_NEPPI|nr:histone-lysine N-methyltransferase SETMAR [Nephila pilipes]
MIAESLNMSVGSVFTIMMEDLKKKKLCARFVPHTLTTEQKEHRIASSEDLIAAADEDPNFLKTIVTADESWCLEYDPETKRQSSEWTSPGKGRPMKVRASKSKTKTMMLVFFDSRGIIHHEFLRQGSTVTVVDWHQQALSLSRGADVRNLIQVNEISNVTDCVFKAPARGIFFCSSSNIIDCVRKDYGHIPSW